MENTESNQAGKRITIRTKNETVYTRPEKLTHLIGEGYLSTVHCDDGSSITVARLLKSFESFLYGYGFIRVNQNTIVNINYIEKTQHRDRYTLRLYGGLEIIVSRRRVKEFKELLG